MRITKQAVFMCLIGTLALHAQLVFQLTSRLQTGGDSMIGNWVSTVLGVWMGGVKHGDLFAVPSAWWLIVGLSALLASFLRSPLQSGRPGSILVAGWGMLAAVAASAGALAGPDLLGALEALRIGSNSGLRAFLCLGAVILAHLLGALVLWVLPILSVGLLFFAGGVSPKKSACQA
jgi:hypothetical protein